MEARFHYYGLFWTGKRREKIFMKYKLIKKIQEDFRSINGTQATTTMVNVNCWLNKIQNIEHCFAFVLRNVKRQVGSYLEHQQMRGARTQCPCSVSRWGGSPLAVSAVTPPRLRGSFGSLPPSSTSTTLYVIFKVIRGEP